MTEIPDDDKKPLTFWQVLGTVLWTALGVSNRERRLRDFERGNGWHFFIAGVIFMALLISGLVLLIQVIIHQPR